jgi:predicted CoA-binding protein
MNHDRYDDGYIRGILNTVKTIAMVGVSANTSRPSYFAFKYLLARGYRVIPVNPGLAGGDLLGQRVYASLAEITEPVEMVDVFRAAQYVPDIVEQTLQMQPRPGVLWMQLGIRNDGAARVAEANGIKVVMDRCPGRIRAAVLGNLVDGREFAHAQLQAGGTVRSRCATHVAQPRHHRGRSGRCRVARRSRRRRKPLSSSHLKQNSCRRTGHRAARVGVRTAALERTTCLR